MKIQMQQNGDENIDAPILNQLQTHEKLPEISITELMHDIDTLDIEKIYFSNDVKHIYAKHSSELQLNELLSPAYLVSNNLVDDISTKVSKTNYYTITQSNPDITNTIVYHSVSKGVEAIIMKPYVNAWAMIADNAGILASNLFSTAILVFFVRYLYQSFMMGIGGGGTFGGMGGTRRGGIGGGIGFPSSMFPIDTDTEDITESKNNTSLGLASWAGSPEIYEECMEVVSYLRNSSFYESAGIEIPKGILLEGPPGTGKTMLARTIANEANANFIYISASELIELYSGMGALRVRNLFEMARMNTPTIIFMDEIDAIGKKRSMSLGGGSNEEREQTLNQLLSELDGFVPNEEILFLGATNRKDILDDALLRPGRFDKIITIPYPDKNSRRAILEKYLSNKNVSSDISLDVFSEITSGFSGAELKKLVNEGMMNTFRRSNGGVEIDALGAQDLYDSLEKMTIGILRKNDTRSEAILFRVAIHELGHGLIAHHFADSFILQKISIQSSYSGAGGYTLFTENAIASEEGLYTRDFLKKRLIVCLGGRVAEDIFYGRDYISLGATQDLKEANELARRMVDFYGMGDGCLETYYNTKGEGESLSNYTLELIEKEIAGILQECYMKAREIFGSYDREKILFLVSVLLANNTIQGGFLYDYFDGKYERVGDVKCECDTGCECDGKCGDK